jgi:hypothetical protein
MRKYRLVAMASAIVTFVMIAQGAALAWGGRLSLERPIPYAGGTAIIDVVADLGGKLGRDPSALRVTNFCWPTGGNVVFVTQRSEITWTSVVKTHVEGTVSFPLTDPAWPTTGSVDCEAYLWRVPNDSVAKSFSLIQFRVYQPPPPPP